MLPRVAALQCPALALSDESTAEQLMDHLYPAVAAGAGLAVLPHLHGLDEPRYLEYCIQAASAYSLWLVTGSYLTGRSLEAAIISPDGIIIGTQQQTHVGAWERQYDVTPGDELRVFATPFGKVGFILGEDIRYPEVARILTLQGAEVLVHLSATPAPFNEEAWLGQLWREVQANQTFGIQSVLLGDGYSGRAAVLAPVGMTADDSGILARTVGNTTEAACAELDDDARHAVIAGYPIPRYFNRDLYAQELLPAYTAPAPPPSPATDDVTVALAQMRMTLATSPEDYAAHIGALVGEAAARGAQLVAFPEYTSLPLLGLLPGAASFTADAGLDTALAAMGDLQISDIFRLASPFATPIYLETFSQLARRFGLYLHAGTLLHEEDGALYNTAHLFGPDGALIGTQHKLHRFTPEDGWLATGSTLQVFELPFGRLAMPVCMDYTYWETTRLAALHGAEILIDAAAGADGDRPWRAARGVRMRVQEVPCYGLHVYGVADLFGQRWRGPSSIYTPMGPLAQAPAGDEECVVVQTLDLAALRRWREEHPLQFNVEMYRRYLREGYDNIP